MSGLVLLSGERVLDDETVSPGFLGFGVFLLLVLATFFLVRSMNKQLRKVPPRFQGDEPEPEPGAGPESAAPGDPSGEDGPAATPHAH